MRALAAVVPLCMALAGPVLAAPTAGSYGGSRFGQEDQASTPNRGQQLNNRIVGCCWSVLQVLQEMRQEAARGGGGSQSGGCGCQASNGMHAVPI